MDAESTTIIKDGTPYTFMEAHKKNASELAEVLGYSLRTVQAMKAAGCPFFGRFSSVQVVRQWEFHNPEWRKLHEIA